MSVTYLQHYASAYSANKIYLYYERKQFCETGKENYSLKSFPQNEKTVIDDLFLSGQHHYSLSLFLDDKSHESPGSAVSFLDVATSPSFLTKDESPLSAVHTNSTGLSKGNREQPAFSSILTSLAGTDQMLPKVSPENPVISNNETHQWLSNRSLERIESSSSELVSNHSSLSGLFQIMQFADF